MFQAGLQIHLECSVNCKFGPGTCTKLISLTSYLCLTVDTRMKQNRECQNGSLLCDKNKDITLQLVYNIIKYWISHSSCILMQINLKN